MLIAILILAIIIVATVLGGVFWFISRAKSSAPDKKTTGNMGRGGRLPFRWGYIILPIAILLLSIVLTAYFYRLLPAEVAYHFIDSSPDGWLSREMIIVWLLVPQLLLVLLAGGIGWGMTKLGALFRASEGTGTKPERIISLMSNMMALPQITLCFAILSIFSYNTYQIYIPVWVLLLVILGLATIALGTLLVLFFLKARRKLLSKPED